VAEQTWSPFRTGRVQEATTPKAGYCVSLRVTHSDERVNLVHMQHSAKVSIRMCQCDATTERRGCLIAGENLAEAGAVDGGGVCDVP
jgi:hypothetical protein